MIKEELIHLIQQRRANVAVLGLGYVGLPLALTFAKAGFYVIGIDPDEDKIEQLNERQSYITDVSNAELRKQIDSGRFRATSDYSVLSEIDAVSISVPTPLRKQAIRICPLSPRLVSRSPPHICIVEWLSCLNPVPIPARPANWF